MSEPSGYHAHNTRVAHDPRAASARALKPARFTQASDGYLKFSISIRSEPTLNLLWSPRLAALRVQDRLFVG